MTEQSRQETPEAAIRSWCGTNVCGECDVCALVAENARLAAHVAVANDAVDELTEGVIDAERELDEALRVAAGLREALAQIGTLSTGFDRGLHNVLNEINHTAAAALSSEGQPRACVTDHRHTRFGAKTIDGGVSQQGADE